MSLEIKPQTLKGPWAAGFALHIHTISSNYLGEDQWGHAQFSTTRSPVGELLYQLKYRQDSKAVDQLAEAAAEFCQMTWKLKIDAIIPAPPSQTRRIQPVAVVASKLAELLGVSVCEGLKKVKKTPQLKDLNDYDERTQALEDAFEVDPKETQGKRLLLVDDIYGSGATVRTIAQVLAKNGGTKAVYLLTLTKKG